MKTSGKRLIFIFVVLTLTASAFAQTPSPSLAPVIQEQAISLKGMLPTIITVAGAILVAFISGFLGYKGGSKAQLHATRKERRQLAYSQLLGHRVLLPQILVSRFEALAFSDYHEALWNLAGSPNDSLDFRESQRWMQKSEDLALETAKSRRHLYETLGLIRAVFKSNQDLAAKLLKAETHKMPAIKQNPFGLKKEEVEAWRKKIIPELQAVVETEISNPLLELAACLQEQIEKDAN